MLVFLCFRYLTPACVQNLTYSSPRSISVVHKNC
uniref:Uncharacterized protein n=1 Tax=Rhizophora mucronata TaxID=61149 RepID=A0A2P2IX81_RHIMU